MASGDGVERAGASSASEEQEVLKVHPEYIVRVYMVVLVVTGVLLAMDVGGLVEGVEGWWIVGAPFMPALAWVWWSHGLIV
ncbi:uncharacterized protein AMSG_00647 [Thecamonas trahens ATCC 50062]|uniref:Uncharacterized protein n=1 Tax=Thecamonas trahens ATCC 50062 TaxID=461836 RepID=A0A0L0DDV7_THETB|nr:hypothetical protein AMSG_00647 [Thecamonas trahens ATCC 50062]KNC50484.1 hypothetical protein AMSG_00647 [Thecamonas trahens ATCC 50062]|eukprot:XP_013762380.1 hypothetical protein AMSG_00647 [Thecamonas trahens ATCC 50062]